MPDPDNAPTTATPAREAGPEAETAEQRAEQLALLRAQLAAQYREEMLALRRELPPSDGELAHPGQRSGTKRWLDDQAEAEVTQFVKSLSEKKEKKKYQLSLIKEYLADPSRFGAQSDVIPTSTSLEEFAERKRDLIFRINLMKMLLALAEEEFELLLRAEAYARAEAEKAAAAREEQPPPA
jgi:hypothetical protein